MVTCDHPAIQLRPEHAKRPAERVLHQTGSSPAREMPSYRPDVTTGDESYAHFQLPIILSLS